MRRSTAAALAFVLLASSAWADVIPSRRPEGDVANARQAVTARLQEFGLAADAAAAHASDLLDDEARYFAASPVRLQLAGLDADEPGVPYGEKMIFGFLGLVASVGVSAIALWANHR